METLKESGFSVNEEFPGVFYIRGNCPFAAQIIVSGRMKPQTHTPLKVLSRNAQREDIISFLEDSGRYISQGDRERIDSICNYLVA